MCGYSTGVESQSLAGEIKRGGFILANSKRGTDVIGPREAITERSVKGIPPELDRAGPDTEPQVGKGCKRTVGGDLFEPHELVGRSLVANRPASWPSALRFCRRR